MAVEPTNFKDLPGPLRIGVALASAGGLLAGVWVVTNELSPATRGKVILGITLGVMAVGLLLVLYTQISKWHKAHQAKPMEQQVLRSAGAGRQGISDPEQLAKIDDLRKKFEEGIATFRAAGKSLYSLPWHVILGEPGSGKTEAIRHCGIGFPPGLHDRYQGVGGTINMNWWFTDHGVIIDTAGRLMFEEASSGGTREWKEFLALMKKFRPNCPINGALLVIPCDSLIRDNADEIERKASQIAQQFDVIQRTLDVRFPVYVVVTKSDLINGFREFFDGISDPQLQHQILGWSNPIELDKPYDSHFVDKYLEEMKTRLFRARLARIGELTANESEDQEKPAADALYAFPHAFEQLGPRLKRYLDLIFSVGSQWSCKPLFFRGIYFTSSMQEGAALDEDLAAALGVPVESLPEGPVWRRDRAYFLRDLFITKVFREGGLVTRATNARKLYARRRAAIIAFAAAGLLVLISLTIYGGLQFRGTVGSLQSVLEPAAVEMDSLPLLERTRFGDYTYEGDKELSNGTPLYAYFADLAAQAVNWRQSKGVPWLFRPAVKLKDFDKNLPMAARKAYLMGVLQSLVWAAIEKASAQSDRTWTWENDEPHVLYYLIALRAGRSFDSKSATDLLDSLMQYVEPQKAEAYADHKTTLADPLLKLYNKMDPPCRDFDDVFVAQIDKATATGVESFNTYWSGPQSQRSELNAITEVVRHLTGMGTAGAPPEADSFTDVEEEFIKRYLAVDPNADLGEKLLAEDFGRLQTAKLRVDHTAGSLENCPSLRQAWQSPIQKHLEILRTSYRRLMEAFPEAISDANQADSTLAKHYRDLEIGLGSCTQKLSDQGFQDRLDGVDSEFWVGGLYDLRFGMYRTAVDRLGQLREMRIADLTSLCDTLQTGRQLIRQDREQIQAMLKLYTERYRVKEGCQASLAILDWGDRRLCRDVLLWWLGNMPLDAASLERYVERESSDRYNLTATAVVFSAWDSINKDGQVPRMPRDIQDRLRRVSQEYVKYARAYIDYCLNVRGRDILMAEIPTAENWRTYHARLGEMSRNAAAVFKKLESCNRQLKGYLTPVENCPHGSETAAKFNEKWASLYNRLDQLRWESILARWYALGDDPYGARTALLRCKPEELVQTYFVSPSDPLTVSPDLYWYRLAVTALDLLAAEVERDARQELGVIETGAGKFPLDRSASENLTVDEVERIRRFSERFVVPAYPPGTLGEGAKTGNTEIDDQIERLRVAAEPSAWIRKIDVLPPAKSKYWCQVCEITTTPGQRVRGVGLAKGSASIVWDDMGGNKKPLGTLSYDCSDDPIQLTLYTLPTRGTLVEEPTRFAGPWAWHRMLEKQEFEKDSSTYVFKQAVNFKGENVEVEIHLRFFREQDCSGSPMEIFVSSP
ncbi:MAG: type VI secretion protein IcmF/TssM N-terminal domain-containing protein [Phycisphaerales bacterium]